MRNLLIIIFCLCFSQGLNAQTSPHYIISSEDFSNTNIYSLHFQESTYSLFAATDRGVFCYRQNKFQPVLPSEKQIGGSLFSLAENKFGQLFCCSLYGQVFETRRLGIVKYSLTKRTTS
jgi:hypothetical protein